MNLTVISDKDDVFVNCECILGYTFKMAAQRGKCTRLTDNFVQLQDNSVRMTVFDASCHIPTS